MNHLIPRTAAILLHAAINWFLLTWIMNNDLTGQWIIFSGFVSLVVILSVFFILHAFTFVYFLKTKFK